MFDTRFIATTEFDAGKFIIDFENGDRGFGGFYGMGRA